MMTAVGVLSLLEAENISKAADIAAAQRPWMRCAHSPLLPRHHPPAAAASGQSATARTCCATWDSEIMRHTRGAA